MDLGGVKEIRELPDGVHNIIKAIKPLLDKIQKLHAKKTGIGGWGISVFVLGSVLAPLPYLFFRSFYTSWLEIIMITEETLGSFSGLIGALVIVFVPIIFIYIGALVYTNKKYGNQLTKTRGELYKIYQGNRDNFLAAWHFIDKFALANLRLAGKQLRKDIKQITKS